MAWLRWGQPEQEPHVRPQLATEPALPPEVTSEPGVLLQPTAGAASDVLQYFYF